MSRPEPTLDDGVLTMRAMVLEQVGAPLVLRDLPRPTAGPGRVLVRVLASGVNPLDVKIAEGAAAHAQVGVPAVLGIDLAGVVAAVGAGVSGFRVGDEVYGMTGGVGSEPGSLAEYVAADADLLAGKPASIDMRAAASLPLVAITAWEALVDRARVVAGDLVLVQGGAGGVGRLAVQLARGRGASVWATGSGAGLDAIAALGAVPLDRTAAPLAEHVERATGGRGFDVVVDTVGGTVLDASFTAVRRHTGRVVSILGWGTHSLAPLSFRGGTYSGVFTLYPLLSGADRAHHGSVLREIAGLVDTGRITAAVDPQRYALEDANRAQAAVAAGPKNGKVVVTVADR